MMAMTTSSSMSVNARRCLARTSAMRWTDMWSPWNVGIAAQGGRGVLSGLDDQ